MVIFLEFDYIFLGYERLPETTDKFSQMSTPSRIPSWKDEEIIASQSSSFLRMFYWNVLCYCELLPAYDLGYQFRFCPIEL